MVRPCWISKTIQAFISFLITCKNEEDPIQFGESRVLTRFSPTIILWKLSVSWKQSSDPIWPKILCSISLTPMMLQIKLDVWYLIVSFPDLCHISYFKWTYSCLNHRRTHIWTPAQVPSYKLPWSLWFRWAKIDKPLVVNIFKALSNDVHYNST